MSREIRLIRLSIVKRNTWPTRDRKQRCTFHYCRYCTAFRFGTRAPAPDKGYRTLETQSRTDTRHVARTHPRETIVANR